MGPRCPDSRPFRRGPGARGRGRPPTHGRAARRRPPSQRQAPRVPSPAPGPLGGPLGIQRRRRSPAPGASGLLISPRPARAWHRPRSRSPAAGPTQARTAPMGSSVSRREAGRRQQTGNQGREVTHPGSPGRAGRREKGFPRLLLAQPRGPGAEARAAPTAVLTAAAAAPRSRRRRFSTPALGGQRALPGMTPRPSSRLPVSVPPWPLRPCCIQSVNPCGANTRVPNYSHRC